MPRGSACLLTRSHARPRTPTRRDALPCVSVERLADFREAVGAERFDAAEVVGVDEAQFFEDLDEVVRDWADNHGKHVVVCGLSGDHQRRPFGKIHRLLATADTCVAERA